MRARDEATLAWRWVQRHCVLLPRSTYLTHVCARRSRQNSMQSVMLSYCCRSPVQYLMMLKQLHSRDMHVSCLLSRSTWPQSCDTNVRASVLTM